MPTICLVRVLGATNVVLLLTWYFGWMELAVQPQSTWWCKSLIGWECWWILVGFSIPSTIALLQLQCLPGPRGVQGRFSNGSRTTLWSRPQKVMASGRGPMCWNWSRSSSTRSYSHWARKTKPPTLGQNLWCGDTCGHCALHSPLVWTRFTLLLGMPPAFLARRCSLQAFTALKDYVGGALQLYPWRLLFSSVLACKNTQAIMQNEALKF